MRSTDKQLAVHWIARSHPTYHVLVSVLRFEKWTGAHERSKAVQLDHLREMLQRLSNPRQWVHSAAIHQRRLVYGDIDVLRITGLFKQT